MQRNEHSIVEQNRTLGLESFAN